MLVFAVKLVLLAAFVIFVLWAVRNPGLAVHDALLLVDAIRNLVHGHPHPGPSPTI